MRIAKWIVAGLAGVALSGCGAAAWNRTGSMVLISAGSIPPGVAFHEAGACGGAIEAGMAAGGSLVEWPTLTRATEDESAVSLRWTGNAGGQPYESAIRLSVVRR